MDKLNPKRRSENMRRIRSKDTSPEIVVRKLVYRLGYRYRLHAANLPGKPDLVFPGRKKAIFVHGCFWHQHTGCLDGCSPHSHTEYWEPKLSRNVARDRQNLDALEQLAWKTLVIWECHVCNAAQLERRIKRFLAPPK